ncbi:High-affnity carbon uptake protein Hat/HatR [Enhygromyxa salina]|uniref:High-affnity carbon uptake protein Hat/HatR n=1 Tax=Enhygromyxa salina TaxID=215803 RepID=A0A0C1ZAH7_9BACT|nr:serine/threonine-protein kinase [Enhygromyxa salina]KIG14629.1 High-affnity carbon uptake protein Hat/HatR [Enhygromyxa salina]
MTTTEHDSDHDERDDEDDRAAPGLLRAGQHQAGFETRRQKQLIASAIFGKPPAPTMLQRYTVLRELGAGGMGMVYLAYDDQLDRRVAIKLLRSRSTNPEAQTRLQREAQAMARLSHPNVVTVYEVGSVDDELFVAMEYVKGHNLRDYLGQTSRTWAEILAVFMPAGEGLAAAHAAGLVHRDFKPDNVLVGDDGRVRVADFGLAYGMRELPKPDPDANPNANPDANPNADLAGVVDPLRTPLTKTGALLGTPAYMAPEQFEGKVSDARTDQFSFCVALWEGLYGRRPFAGANLARLAEAVSTGNIDAPGHDTAKVPPWLRAVVERGLAPDPDARWPSMPALLSALALDPIAQRRRRVRARAITTATVLLLGALAWLAASELQHNARQRYWNALTEQLLDIERARGLGQATDDAERARAATKMSVYRSYRAKIGITDHSDPTIAATLLKEIGDSGRTDPAWISAANLTLGRPLSHALLTGHDDTIFALAFAPGEDALYSAAADGEVWRWEFSNATGASGRGELLFAHEGTVTSLVLDPTGQLLVSASEDGTVRAWPTTATANPNPQLLTRHAAGVTAARFDPSGRVLATSSRDNSARLIELDTRVTTVLGGHTKAVQAVSFDPTGARVLTASSDNTARLWRVEDGAPLALLEGHTRPVFHAQFVGEDWVVTGSDDGTVRGYRLHADAGEPGFVTDHGAAITDHGAAITDHGAAITAIATSGSRFASADVNGSVRVVTPSAPELAVSIEGHTGGVWALAFTPDNNHLITTSFDGTARVSSADGRGPARVLIGHREPLLRLAISSSGRWLATGSWDTDVRTFDLERAPLEIPLAAHKAPLQRVAIDRQGTRVLTASSDATARLWDARTGSELGVLRGDQPLNVAVFSPDGERVATGHSDGAVLIWELASGNQLRLDEHESAVRDLAFSPTGDRLASAGSDGVTRIWDAQTGALLLELRGHDDAVLQVEFGELGARVFTASADATLRVWDARTGAVQAVLTGHEGAIRSFARSPDPGDDQLATASDDHSARIWPDDDPTHALVLRGHTKKLHAVAFDPAGTQVVTASADGTARIWDAHTGAPLATLRGHSQALWGAMFIDSTHVVSHADDNTLRLWTLGRDASTIELSGHTQPVTGLALSPDARWMVSASVDGSARIWDISQLSSDPAVLVERLRAATVACLGVDQRMRDLGESQAEAEAEVARAACQ